MLTCCISKPCNENCQCSKHEVDHVINVAFVCSGYNDYYMHACYMYMQLRAFWLCCCRHCVQFSSMKSATTMMSRCRSLPHCRLLHAANECMLICVKDRFSFVNWLVSLASHNSYSAAYVNVLIRRGRNTYFATLYTYTCVLSMM